MNKWLYRAVGAVGVASGALLLSNGVANAQAPNDARPDLDPQAMRGLVSDFFTPMGQHQHREEELGGLLGGGGPLGGLTGGGAGNLLSGLAGGDKGGLLSGLIGGQGPLGGLASGLAGLAGLAGLGGGDGTNPLAALSELPGGQGLANLIGSPGGEAEAPAATTHRPAQPGSEVARQVDGVTEPMVDALIADEVAERMQLPGVSAIMGLDSPLNDLVENFTNGVPVVGEVLNGKLDPANVTKLPVVNQLLTGFLPNMGDANGLPTADGVRQQNLLGEPLRGQLRDPHGDPLRGQLRDPHGDPLRGPLEAPARTPGSNNGAKPSGLPDVLPAPQGAVTGAPHRLQATKSPVHVGRHRATDRPEVIDPELETAPGSDSLPLVGSLTGVADSAMGGNVGTLPLSTLVRNVPLVNDVPLVGELGTQLKVLKALPLVGTFTGLVPVESDTAA